MLGNIRDQVVVFLIYIFAKVLKYFFMYDKVAIHVGDSYSKGYNVRRYYLDNRWQLLETVVVGMADMRTTLDHDMYKDFMEQLAEHCEKQSRF